MSLDDLDENGYTVLRGSLDAAVAEEVRSRLSGEMRAALALPDHGASSGITFATIHDRVRRDDMCLLMTDENRALVCTIINRFPDVFLELLGPSAKLVEFGVIASYPGAKRQTIHADVTYDPDARRVYTAFVALQDITREMGPTNIWAGTQSAYWCEFYKPRMLGPVDPYYDENPPDQMAVAAGDAVLMDTRVMHAGGDNLSEKDRLLFYFSLETQDKEKPPVGLTKNIHPSLKDTIALADFFEPAPTQSNAKEHSGPLGPVVRQT